MERQQAAAEQEAVAGEGVDGPQGELVEVVGAKVFELSGAEGGGVKVCHLSMVAEVGGRTSSFSHRWNGLVIGFDGEL